MRIYISIYTFVDIHSDLVHTTESLRHAKLSAGKTETESRSLDALLEPYKADNGRLVKESNELHLALLTLKEDKDRVCRGESGLLRSCWECVDAMPDTVWDQTIRIAEQGMCYCICSSTSLK